MAADILRLPLVVDPTTGLTRELEPGEVITTSREGVIATNTTGSTILTGKVIHLYNNAGTLSIRLASAAAGAMAAPETWANGFAVEDIPNNSSGFVFTDGIARNVPTVLTPGARYFLSTTAGDVTTTAPSAANQIAQVLGYAISTSEIQIEISDPIERH